MITNLTLYKRAASFLHDKFSLFRRFNKNKKEMANENGESKINNHFNDGIHFKKAQLELLIEGQIKTVTLDYQDTENQVGFTLADIEALKTDLKERYENDPHSGLIRYRLFNDEMNKEEIPFIEPRKNNGLAQYVDLEFMIDGKVETVTLNAQNTKNKKGFAIKDMKEFDYDLKKNFGYKAQTGVLRFKLYNNAFEYTKDEYVYMNVQKIMTHSDLFDYFRNDPTLLNVTIQDAEEDVAFLTFKKWLDIYNSLSARIPRIIFYENGQSYPLLDNDRAYYYVEPIDNITHINSAKSLHKSKQRKITQRLAA